MIILKSNRELDIMRQANRIIAIILSEIGDRIRPGVSTYELDRWAEDRILDLKARPAFKGYGGRSRLYPYPATLCTSINHEVVHGIPSRDKILAEGNIVSIDVGSLYQGYYGDGAYTYAVGRVSDRALELMQTCQQALDLGIQAARSGKRLSDISQAIDRCVRDRGFEIVRDLSGHGIGKNLHEEPQVLNFFEGPSKETLKVGMTLAIEPMITAGTYRVRTLADNWTVVTADGSLAAHFEHTVAITDNGPEILTRL